jgi:DNA-binding NarL/FixJ family response regulator
MVIITGHQMDEEMDELVAQGLSGWLMKPVEFDGLASLLEQALRQTGGKSR